MIEEIVLKGGYSMILRNPKARATRDIDLAIRFKKSEDNKDRLLDFLRECALINMNDYFEFQVELPKLDLKAIPYGGKRFPVKAKVNGKLFVRFPIDIIETSLILAPLENLKSRDWLGFAGIKSMPYPTISKEQQFAEKLHAYTFPRDEDENSRVKDLVDMFLLIENGQMSKDFLRQSIKEVFRYRKTHKITNYLMEYPENWIPKYDRLRRECHIHHNLEECFFSIANFLRWPVIVSKEQQADTYKLKCHFCGKESQSWRSKIPETIGGAINEAEEMEDYDCKNCGPYRITGAFADMNRSENDSKNWKLWENFLKNRFEAISTKRLLISSLNAFPDFEEY